MTLQGKVALVTGGGSGIGRASAIALAQAGAYLAIADMNGRDGDETVALVRSAGGQASCFRVDVSNADQVARLVQDVLTKYGQLDCAVNSAGIRGNPVPLAQQEVAEFDRIVAINLRGVFLCMKYQITAMLQRGGGAIVNIASVQGLVANAGAAVYAASKHGVIGLTKGAALDNARTGIRVNAVCPGTIDTPMAQRAYRAKGLPMPNDSPRLPIGRVGRPEEVAHAVRWLCSDESSYVTGASLPVDGALTAQ